ncbi:MAG TPA: tannase/feruloyl esterase family alpha/beta hydrolase [Steroidobacteraceae bacterium]|nr:tannase/feruloyl esterase family alpha/beta hydrolase [Steroidobacteraceae bacterium]
MRWILLGLLVLGCGTAGAQGRCQALAHARLPQTTITLAQLVPAGGFQPPHPFSLAGPQQPSYAALPAFCRIAAEVRPAKGSVIRFELWLPAAGWNGKFLGVGNGGYSGEIWYPAMIEPLTRGYATASTDTGHQGAADDASFALDHPEKWIDFAYRAVHEMTLQSKALVRAFYTQPAKLAYWSGCSTGGRQGLMSAQRYPTDFDGIIAGAPANYMTHLSAQGVWAAQALHRDPGSLISPSKLQALHQAVLKACDALDGVSDGVLEDPRRCQFDPEDIACRPGSNGPQCLTSAQLDAVRALYSPVRNPRTKQLIFPGMMFGSEAGWAGGIGPDKAQTSPLITGIFRFVVFMDPHWDYMMMNFDSDIAQADMSDAALANAIDPRLQPFFARGGKLIQYHGWADPGISPLNSIDYYESVARQNGGEARLADRYRLFMVPGMDHCRGGDGTDQFDMLSALEGWVEHHQAPEQILASRVRDGKVDRTRPLCPYPKVASYKGSGSTDDAANFLCKAP